MTERSVAFISSFLEDGKQERGTVDVVSRVAKTEQIQKTQMGHELVFVDVKFNRRNLCNKSRFSHCDPCVMRVVVFCSLGQICVPP